MILDTMTLPEVRKEMERDKPALEHTIEKRLLPHFRQLYAEAKKRARLKLKKPEHFKKVYEVKTARKNLWIVAIEPDKHENGTMLTAPAVIHLQGKRTMLFHQYKNGLLCVFPGHFLRRFNERLNLGLTEPLDKAKRFLMNNQMVVIKNEFTEIDAQVYTAIGTIREGLALGEYDKYDNVAFWKTFISNEQYFASQAELRAKSIDFVKAKVEQAKGKFDKALLTELMREAEALRAD